MAEITKEDLDKAVEVLRMAIQEVKQEVQQSKLELKEEIDAKTEKVETRLLSAFYNWASPVDNRLRRTERNDADVSERLAMIERRVADIEQGRSSKSAT